MHGMLITLVDADCACRNCVGIAYSYACVYCKHSKQLKKQRKFNSPHLSSERACAIRHLSGTFIDPNAMIFMWRYR